MSGRGFVAWANAHSQEDDFLAQQEAERLYASGYCPTSNRYRMASRLDRPDWKEHMSAQRVEGFPGDMDIHLKDAMDWANGLGDGAADFYRRVHSKDTLRDIPEDVFRRLKKLTQGSGWGGLNEYRDVVPRETEEQSS
jgi:hypothetical protein